MAHESSDRPLLPLEINAATREYHTALNRLIIARLPLCLPPYSTTPTLYMRGISLFGQIYMAIEYPWEDSIHIDSEIDDDDEEAKICRRKLRSLRALLLPSALMRVDKLRHDLDLLARTTGQDLSIFDCATSPMPDWSSRIKESLLKKPHVLLAYTWVMYMALFNGGRWMRSQLRKAAPEFWKAARADCHNLDDDNWNCLSFWDIGLTGDGEEVKTDFKSRFHEQAEKLTDPERQDVIDEAAAVFRTCAKLVEDLDAEAAALSTTENTTIKRTEPRHESISTLSGLPAVMVGNWGKVIISALTLNIKGSGPTLVDSDS